ncbi:hypothetical protein TNIN_194931 [Trichonephila inaurata madagascariensis]|uniref:PDE1 N-terminal domain-containing protein n=1 Tax=Trichonephila inaurata madagascariensis TaxID=2747483 RepID=A0A8X6XFR6_9ARAC|nr:hypothetical protein TNIN_194931 [Trichonephila inaurata madagascariensis]
MGVRLVTGIRNSWQLLGKSGTHPVFSLTFDLQRVGDVRPATDPGVIISSTYSDDPMANPPDDEDTTPSKDEDSQNSPGAGGAVLVRKTKDSNQRSPTNGEGEEELPPVDTLEACDKAAERLRELSNHLNDGEIPMDVLQQTVGYAVSVLEAIYMDEAKRLLDEDDELSEVQPDAVPPEVREWLASTFTRQMSTTRRRSEDKLRFRSVAHAIRAGIMVDRIYRRLSSSSNLQMPAQIAQLLKVSGSEIHHSVNITSLRIKTILTNC